MPKADGQCPSCRATVADGEWSASTAPPTPERNWVSESSAPKRPSAVWALAFSVASLVTWQVGLRVVMGMKENLPVDFFARRAALDDANAAELAFTVFTFLFLAIGVILFVRYILAKRAST